MQNGNVAAVEDVSRVYNPGENEVRAIHRVSLSFGPSEFVALVGSSGSGKSTLLNMLGCLDPPTEGRVFVGGQETTDLDSGELSRIRNHQIGFVFQSFNLIPVLTAYENIEFSLQIAGGVARSEMADRVTQMLELLGLSPETHRRPNQLSGGQQQRVAIGRALVKNPSLVLADEPTANLDSKTSEDIISLMHQMRQELGVTFIFATHDHQLMSHAQRVVKLRDGEILSDEIQGG